MSEEYVVGEVISPVHPSAPPQRLWRVATVMATGVFATTFTQLQGLGYLPFNHLFEQMKLDSDKAATFFFWGTLPWSFKPIAGLLVDGVPLFGSRRRAYLLLSALVAIAMWVTIGLAPTNFNVLTVLAVSMNVSLIFGSTTCGGLLVEAGQTFGVSGRISSLRVFAQNLGAALGLPVGGWLAAYALGCTSAAAIFVVASMFFSAWFLLREPVVVRVDHGRSFGPQFIHVCRSIFLQIKNVMRWQMLWPAVLLFFLQAVPTFRSTCFYQYQTQDLHYNDAQLGILGFVGYGVALLSSGLYAWGCNRMPLRVSLYVAIFVIALSALPSLSYPAYTPYMPRAMAIEGVSTFLLYLGYLPLFDLVVRSTPKGSEALGYSVLIGVWNLGLMIGAKTGPMLYEHSLKKDMNSLIWLNAVITLAGVIFVFLIPKMLVEKREGK